MVHLGSCWSALNGWKFTHNNTGLMRTSSSTCDEICYRINVNMAKGWGCPYQVICIAELYPWNWAMTCWLRLEDPHHILLFVHKIPYFDTSISQTCRQKLISLTELQTVHRDWLLYLTLLSYGLPFHHLNSWTFEPFHPVSSLTALSGHPHLQRQPTSL